MSKPQTDTVPSLGSHFDQRRKLRRIRMIVDLTSSLIRSDSSLSYREACCLVECAEKAISELVPDYRETFEYRIKPRLNQIILERWPTRAHWLSSSIELVN
jgi:hypothetical protein